MKRCSKDFDDLVKHQQKVWKKEAEELGIPFKLSETDITKVFARKLKTQKIRIKDIGDLL